MKLAIFGASGRTGKEAMLQALIKGHEVKVLVRNRASIDLKDSKLQVIEGDVCDAAAVESVVRDTEVVLVALGARSSKEASVHSIGTSNIVAAMKANGLKRIVVVSSAGLYGSKDSSFFFGSVIRPLFLKKVFDDKVKQLEILEQSGLEWILIRPSRLIDGQKTGKYNITEDKPMGKNIARADVAAFMLAHITSNKYVHKMPILSY